MQMSKGYVVSDSIYNQKKLTHNITNTYKLTIHTTSPIELDVSNWNKPLPISTTYPALKFSPNLYHIANVVHWYL